MVGNPCICGCTLQAGTRILALIDMLFSVMTAGLGIFTLIAAFILLGAKDDSNTDQQVIAVIIIITIIILVSVAQFVLAFILLQGSNQRESSKCKIWFMFTAILTLLTIFSFIYSASSGQDPTTLVVSIISILYKLFGLSVVYAFLKELKMSNNVYGPQNPNGGPMTYPA